MYGFSDKLLLISVLVSLVFAILLPELITDVISEALLSSTYDHTGFKNDLSIDGHQLWLMVCVLM